MTALRAAVGGLACFLLLAVGHPRPPVSGWDRAVARAVGGHLPNAVEWIARPPSWAGGGVAMMAVALACVGALLVRGRRLDAAVVALAYLGSEIATQILKLAFDRARPSFSPAVDLPSSASFPSGHAAVSLAVLVTIAAVVGRRQGVTVALAASGLIGLSRVALGVHWLSDVVAGWALGGCWAGACLLLRGRPRGRR